VIAALAALAVPAHADDHDVVFAINRTQLHKRPGEAAPVVGHADQGDELEVLGDQGRWLRVRDGKQVGWVTRTEVAPSKPAEPRNRPERSGFSGKHVPDAVKVTIQIDRVRGFDDPRTKTRSVLDLARGDAVTVLGRGYNGWILVEPDGGSAGWIPASAVTDAGKVAGDPRQAPSEIQKVAAAPEAAAAAPVTVAAAPVTVAAGAARPAGPAGPVEASTSRPVLRGTLLATAGAQTFKKQQSGNADGVAIAAGELASIAADAQLRVRGDLWVGLGTTAELGKATLTYYGPAEPSAPMSTREISVDAYAELGLGNLPHLAVRGGVHYATFSVKSDRAEAMLIGERIAGATVGVAGTLPLGRRLALSAATDIMPVGAQRMSRVPPGTLYATTVRGGWARGALTMALPAHLVAAVSYRFGILTAHLTDDAATPKTASRTDLSHEVTAGVGMTW
jgi:hypothetical protein